MRFIVLFLIENIASNTLKRLPDAIIFGVRKGGTRALLEFIDMHDQVAAAGQEVHFFDRDGNYGNANYTWYRNQMPEARDDQIVMEKTPRYFVVRKALVRMEKLVIHRKEECKKPSASSWTCKPLKLILIVREPVSRLISGYTQIQNKRVAAGKTPGPSLESEVFINGDPNKGLNMNDQKVKTSYYHKFIGSWKRRFGGQLLVLDSAELIKTPWVSIEKTEKHLNLQPQITKEDFVIGPKGFYCKATDNPSGMRCLSSSKGRFHVEVSEKIQTRLRELFVPLNKEFYSDMKHDYGWNKY